ncbi:MAG: hypothetical protein V4532_18435 [Pseudomonadota bacterium]
MTFDARDPTHDTKHSGHHLVGTKLRPDLLAKVGETFAMALCSLQSRLTPDASGTVDSAQLRAAQTELARLERLGLQIQEVARVLAGEGSWVTERLDLSVAIQEAMNLWADKATQLGIPLSGPRGPFETDVNPAVLEQLIELGIEYALHIGQRVELRCGMEGNPPFPMLTIDIHRAQPIKGMQEPENFNDLQWLLFSTLASASGFAPQRQSVGTQVLLTLALATANNTDTATPAAAIRPEISVAVGRRVLLVDEQDVSRVQAHLLLHDVGMYVDATVSIEQALDTLGDTLHTQTPDVLLTSVATDEPACRALIDTLRAKQPRLRVVELVDDDSAFAFSVPGSDLPARVGRHDLARTLVVAITQELETALQR